MESKEKLKILYLLQFFIPAWRFGGVVQFAYNIAKGMVQRGHDVTVFSTDAFELGRRIKEKTNIIDGIKITYFKNINNYLASKLRIVQPRLLKKELKDHIKDYDIIHLLDIYSISTYWAYKYAKRHKIPYFITTNGVLSDHSQKNRGIIKKIFNIIIKKVLLNAQSVIVQTESEEKDCTEFGLNNLNRIKIGINLSEFSKLPPKTIFRKKYNIKDDDIIVLFLGRINEVKGIKYLIEAISYIKNSKVLLYIVGPKNSYLNLLQKQIQEYKISDRVIVIDGLYDDAKLEAYMGADIYCLPSIYDCAPNTLLEACACGLPIITTTSNGLFEIARDGAGIVVDPGDSKALRNAILDLIRNRNKMKQLGIKGKKIIQKNFDWDDKLNELELLYYSKLR